MSAESSTPPTVVARSAAMPFIMITVLIDMMSIGLIIPVLPALVGQFAATQSAQNWAYVGVAFAFSFANFLASPIIGALSDRYGRRPVLLVGFCALATSFIVTGLATALWMLIVVRLFSGAMQSNLSVANAYVADITPAADRARRFGQLGAAFGVGFILGPTLGGLLGEHDVHLPFFVAGGLALVNLVYGYFVLPESLPASRRRAVDWRVAANPFASLASLGRLSGIGLLVATIACSALAQFILYTNWVLHNHQKFGWGPRENGWSLFAVGVMSALVQGLLLGKLLKRFSAQRLVVAGLVSSSLAYLGWGLASEGWMIYAVILLNVLGFTAGATLQSVVSGAVDATRQGTTMGAVSGLQSLMAVVAPLVSGPLLAIGVGLPRGDWRIGSPFYACAALQAAALAMAWWHFYHRPAQRKAAAAAAAQEPV